MNICFLLLTFIFFSPPDLIDLKLFVVCPSRDSVIGCSVIFRRELLKIRIETVWGARGLMNPRY